MRGERLEGRDGERARAEEDRPDASVVRRRGPSTTRRAVVLTLFGLLLVAIAVSVALVVRALMADDSRVVAAPELVGLTQEQAIEELAERGLRVDQVTPRFAERPAGTILAQTPNGGIVVPRDGGSVDLVVSQGIDVTAIPAVVGAGVYKLKDVPGSDNPYGWGPTLLATVVSFVVGYAAIAWLLKYVTTHSYTPFVVYRIALGTLTLALVATGVIAA